MATKRTTLRRASPGRSHVGIPGSCAAPRDAVDAAASAQTLRVRGLMAIPRPTDSGPPMGAFEAMGGLLSSVSDRVEGPPVLSMGMSSDFEAAIAMGSTAVRVGTALFGTRES